MEINRERMLSDLKALREITDTPGEGVTRFSYGQKDREARAYITQAAKAAGLAVTNDAIGNMYIDFHGVEQRLSQKASEASCCKAKKILIGSHIDTVRNGGWLDGIYGVIAGLEVMRTLAEGAEDDGGGGRGTLETPIQTGLVIFAEEEGSNFGSTMTGSKFTAGIYGEKELDGLKDDRGVTLRQMLEGCGYPAYKREEVVWDFDRVKAMLELHIEQGPVLDRKGLSIGVVDTVYGMSVVEITLQGAGNHAGASPMEYRRDALAAAALCISAAEEIARRDPEGITVATAGKISVSPNCSNVIPEKAIFTVEVRDKEEGKIHSAMEEIKAAIGQIAVGRGLDCQIREVAFSAPIQMNESIKGAIAEQASRCGFPYQIMNSGAVHDACMIAAHAPAGMIFVPSRDGRSHVPFEDTAEEDLVRGAQLLLDTINAL